MFARVFEGIVFAALIAWIFAALNFACLMDDRCAVVAGLL